MTAVDLSMSLAICGFVFSILTGWAACMRAGKFTIWPHWISVLSVLCLAYMAWPARHQHVIHVDRPQPQHPQYTHALLKVMERLDYVAANDK